MRSATMGDPDSRAFKPLERALIRRRLRELDPRLSIEIALLALLLAATLFWQVRVPLDGWARHHGPWAALEIAAALFGVVALVRGALSAGRLTHSLGADAPAWLALPCETSSLEGHLLRTARGFASWFVLVAQLALGAALFGLVPFWALLGLFVAAIVAGQLAARAGAELALRAALQYPARDPLVALATALARRERGPRSRPLRAPRPYPRRPLGALLVQDLALTARTNAARSRALFGMALTLAAALVWFAGWPPALLRAVAFGLALLAAAAWAEWLIETSGLHPFATLRALPVGVGAFWGARVAGAVVATLLILASQLFAMRHMDAVALRVHLVWTTAAALAITVFGANVAVTLYPRTHHARRVFTLSLALAATASYILPLAGWVLLLTALLHSARRLPPWTRGELLT